MDGLSAFGPWPAQDRFYRRRLFLVCLAWISESRRLDSGDGLSSLDSLCRNGVQEVKRSNRSAPDQNLPHRLRTGFILPQLGDGGVEVALRLRVVIDDEDAQ